VVGQHQADEPGVVADPVADGRRLDVAAAGDGEPVQLEAAVGELLQRFNDARVLDRGSE
jgi:hypothetical protein